MEGRAALFVLGGEDKQTHPVRRGREGWRDGAARKITEELEESWASVERLPAPLADKAPLCPGSVQGEGRAWSSLPGCGVLEERGGGAPRLVQAHLRPSRATKRWTWSGCHHRSTQHSLCAVQVK